MGLILSVLGPRNSSRSDQSATTLHNGIQIHSVSVANRSSRADLVFVYLSAAIQALHTRYFSKGPLGPAFVTAL